MDRLPRQLSSTAYPIEFIVVLSTDHLTAATGKTVTVTISKNGGAFGPVSGAVTEIGSSGVYKLAGNASDRDTLGPLAIHATATGCDPVDFIVPITTIDPFAANWGISNVTAYLTGIISTALTETVAGYLTAGFKKFFNVVTPTSDMNTITTVTTTTNLTNAPTNGDFTTAMKTSLDNSTPSVTVSDKTGFSLSTAGIQAIWDALASAQTTVGSLGKLIVDTFTTLLTRIPGVVQPQTGDSYARLGAPVGASISADIATIAGGIDFPTVDEIVGGVLDELLSAHTDPGSTAAVLSAIAVYAARITNSTAIQVVSPVAANQKITVIRGDDYKNVDGRAISFTLSNCPSIIGAQSVLLIVNRGGVSPSTFSGTVDSATTFHVDLTSVDTLTFNPGSDQNYDIQVTLANGDIITPVQGKFIVTADVR